MILNGDLHYDTHSKVPGIYSRAWVHRRLRDTGYSCSNLCRRRAGKMNRFGRKTLLYYVTVDGRIVGDGFRYSYLAEDYAETLKEEAPWALISIRQSY